MKKIFIIAFILLSFFNVFAQDVKPFNLTQEWLSKIEKLAPTSTNTKGSKKNILIFSFHTGYNHWTIPHTEAVIKLIAEKSGDFNVTVSKDIALFEKKSLRKYDAIILNNNCSIGGQRNLFWDALEIDSTLSDIQRSEKATQLENNLLKYVKKGSGLMVMHGAIVMQNKSQEFGKMVGGSFDYHPKQQNIHC